MLSSESSDDSHTIAPVGARSAIRVPYAVIEPENDANMGRWMQGIINEVHSGPGQLDTGESLDELKEPLTKEAVAPEIHQLPPPTATMPAYPHPSLCMPLQLPGIQEQYIRPISPVNTIIYREVSCYSDCSAHYDFISALSSMSRDIQQISLDNDDHDDTESSIGSFKSAVSEYERNKAQDEGYDGDLESLVE
jgi:hypothetical protein